MCPNLHTKLLCPKKSKRGVFAQIQIISNKSLFMASWFDVLGKTCSGSPRKVSSCSAIPGTGGLVFIFFRRLSENHLGSCPHQVLLCSLSSTQPVRTETNLSGPRELRPLPGVIKHVENQIKLRENVKVNNVAEKTIDLGSVLGKLLRGAHILMTMLIMYVCMYIMNVQFLTRPVWAKDLDKMMFVLNSEI